MRLHTINGSLLLKLTGHEGSSFRLSLMLGMYSRRNTVTVKLTKILFLSSECKSCWKLKEENLAQLWRVQDANTSQPYFMWGRRSPDNYRVICWERCWMVEHKVLQDWEWWTNNLPFEWFRCVYLHLLCWTTGAVERSHPKILSSLYKMQCFGTKFRRIHAEIKVLEIYTVKMYQNCRIWVCK